MSIHDNWTVLLIGGVSGTGKSTVAAELGLSLGIPRLQVDDLRLAFQRSRVQLPENADALYYFAGIDNEPDIWQRDPHELRDALISVAELLSPGLEAIIENHIDQQQPIILEGDGIAPSLLARQALQDCSRKQHIRSVFLVERNEETLFANMRIRARGIAHMDERDLRAEARAKILFGEWIIAEAAKYDLPVLEVRPWDTLIDRIVVRISQI